MKMILKGIVFMKFQSVPDYRQEVGPREKGTGPPGLIKSGYFLPTERLLASQEELRSMTLVPCKI
jgi:hypothetical protein